MPVKEQSSLKFNGVEIVNTYFNSERKIEGKDETSIVSSIRPKVFIPKDNDSKFSIIIDTELSVKDHFVLKVGAIGAFEILGTVNSEIRNSFINLNAPSIMFPYIRSFISTFTSNIGSGMPTLTIPPHIFSGDLESFKQEE